MPDLRYWLVFVEAFTIVVLLLMVGALISESFYSPGDDDER